jgi:hypothetical protein
MASRKSAPYRISMLIQSRTDVPIHVASIDITEDDLRLGIPSRIYGDVNKALAEGVEQITLIERRKRAAPETVDLQESQ